MAKNKSYKKKTPIDLAGLLRLHDSVADDFMQKWEEGTRNEGRVVAENWTDEQKKEFKDQDRQAYSMPLNASYLQRISATQKQSRQGWKVEASVDPNDEVKAVVANQAMQDFERVNDLKHVESEVFEDAIGPSFGVDKLYVDYTKGYPEVKNKRIDYKNIVWDLNDIDYSLNQTLFIAEIEKRYRFELEAEGWDVSTATDTTSGLVGRPKQSYYATTVNQGDPRGFEIVSVFNHWQRVHRDYYCVLFKDSANLHNFEEVLVAKFETRAEANRYIKDLKMSYMSQGIPFFNAKGEPEAEILVKTEIRYDYYKFFYNKILDYQKTNLEHHPYNLYFAIKSANNWTSLMSFMSSMQIFMDRLWSQIDYSFKKELKQVYEMDVNSLAEGEDKEDAIDIATKVGGVVPKAGPNPVFTEVPSSGFNPQYMQTISIMTEYMSQILGGANFQGNKESSSESGRAVALRQRQGSLVASLFLDNLSRYKQAKGRKVLYYLQKFDTSQRIIKVMGGELKEQEMQLLQENGLFQPTKVGDYSGYITLNKEGQGLSFLKDSEFELTVTEVPLTETQKQAKLMDALEAEKIDPLLQQSMTWRMYKLDVLGLPKAQQEALKNEYEANMKAQQEARQRDEAREDVKLNIEKAKVLNETTKIKYDKEKADKDRKSEVEKAEKDATKTARGKK